MNRRPSPRISRLAERGFAIVSAIFLLVALAALGAFMVTFSNTQHLTSTQDIQGSRAYWAARGGVQWAAGWIVVHNACPAVSPAFADGFSVAVVCTSQTYMEGETARTIYRIRATASTNAAVGSIAFVEREVVAYLE